MRGAAVLVGAVAAVVGTSALGPAPASALVGGLGGAVATTVTPAPTIATTTPALPASIRLTGISPSLVTPTGTLTVTGVVTNIGSDPLVDVTARLLVVHAQLSTRDELGAWLNGTDTRTGTLAQAEDVEPRPLPAGASTTFRLEVPAGLLGLQDFGAYGIAVDMRAQLESGREQVGLVRSTVQWQPRVREYQSQQIAFLVPFTGLPAGQDGQPPTDAEVAAAVAPGSRLADLLAGASGKNVSWAVDPSLLQRLARVAAVAPPEPAGADPAPSTATGTPTVTPTGPALEASRRTVADFLAAMRRAAAGRAVVELPYADPDLVAATAPATPGGTGRTDLVRAARPRGAGIVADVLGVTPDTQVGWPVGGWADDGTLAALAASGVRDVVLDERARRLVDALPYTPDARADLGNDLTGWLSDPGLSSLVGAATTPDVRRVQQLLAETATVTAERPSLVRRLLVVAPRDLDPRPDALQALVTAASTVPWLKVVPVTDLDAPLPGDTPGTADLLRRASAVPAPVAAAQLGAAHVAAVRRYLGTLAALGEVVESASGLTDTLQGSTLQLMSTSWRGQPGPLRQRREVVAAQVSGLNDRLQVLRSSVNLLASSGTLQITVVNSLPQAVAGARLEVTSGNPRLLVQTPDVEVPDLATGTRTQVEVPVRAIAGGVVQLQARLVSPSGRPLGKAVTVTVRAQPTGSWALWVVGGVVALVLAVGLVRALRRPRRRRTLTTEEA